jgi:hypothetical protein
MVVGLAPMLRSRVPSATRLSIRCLAGLHHLHPGRRRGSNIPLRDRTNTEGCGHATWSRARARNCSLVCVPITTIDVRNPVAPNGESRTLCVYALLNAGASSQAMRTYLRRIRPPGKGRPDEYHNKTRVCRSLWGPYDSLWGPTQVGSTLRESKLQPHFESPQFRHVMQPSIMTTAAVLHLPHNCAPSGKCDFEKASVCFARASNSARFSSTIFC